MSELTDKQTTMTVLLKPGSTCLYCHGNLSHNVAYSAWPEATGSGSMRSGRRMVIVNHDNGSFHKVRIGRIVKDLEGARLKLRLKELYPEQRSQVIS